MRHLIKSLTKNVIIGFSSLLFVTSSFAFDSLSEATLKQKGMAFVQATEARLQPGTTVADIEHYISLLSDNFIDEYVHYQVTFAADKNKLRARLIEKMNSEISDSKVTMQQMMVGPNVVVLKLKQLGQIKPVGQGDVIPMDKVSVLTLEFNKNGLISHIRRHEP